MQRTTLLYDEAFELRLGVGIPQDPEIDWASFEARKGLPDFAVVIPELKKKLQLEKDKKANFEKQRLSSFIDAIDRKYFEGESEYCDIAIDYLSGLIKRFTEIETSYREKMYEERLARLNLERAKKKIYETCCRPTQDSPLDLMDYYYRKMSSFIALIFELEKEVQKFEPVKAPASMMAKPVVNRPGSFSFLPPLEDKKKEIQPPPVTRPQSYPGRQAIVAAKPSTPIFPPISPSKVPMPRLLCKNADGFLFFENRQYAPEKYRSEPERLRDFINCLRK